MKRRAWIIGFFFLLGGCQQAKGYFHKSPKRMHGLWRNDFEGSIFCSAPASACSYVMSDKRREPLVWLDFSGPLPMQYKQRIKGLGGLYEVEFVGRRSMFRGHYGHMGMSDEEVIVDRMISIKEVETPMQPRARVHKVEE